MRANSRQTKPLPMPQVTFDRFTTEIKTTLGCFATDTLPALAIHPTRAAQIYPFKQRSLDKPLILMAADLEQIWPYVQGSTSDRHVWQTLMAQYWPGALTLVLPSSDRIPPAMNPKNNGTIGIRIPNHDLARTILRRTGPLATTSVNRSGEPALEQAAAIQTQFPELLMLAEFGPLGSGQASTVLNWNGAGWEILRQGAVSLIGV
jgi:L-threonylcarbamoyladenylate synthase